MRVEPLPTNTPHSVSTIFAPPDLMALSGERFRCEPGGGSCVVAGMKRMLVIFGAAVILLAQGFEIASIKPNRSGLGGSSIRGSAGRVTMENVPLRKLTLWAYGIPDDREYALVGPDWLGSERFDIQATFPAGAGP